MKRAEASSPNLIEEPVYISQLTVDLPSNLRIGHVHRAGTEIAPVRELRPGRWLIEIKTKDPQGLWWHEQLEIDEHQSSLGVFSCEFYEVSVERLLQHYDPFWNLGFQAEDHFETSKTKNRWPLPRLAEVERFPHASYVENVFSRTLEYHLGRFAFFVDMLRKNRAVDPIEIDNVCHAGTIYPQATLLDGHHRLGAAALINHPTLLAVYGGRLDLLDWLTGQTDTEPEA